MAMNNGLEVLFKGEIYKADAKNRSVSLLCLLQEDESSINLGAYNYDSSSIDRWLIAPIELNDEIVVQLKVLDLSSPLLENVPEETPEEKEKHKKRALANFRRLEEYLKANNKL